MAAETRKKDVGVVWIEEDVSRAEPSTLAL